MDIRQLRYFVGVVEAGSFTKAAEQLHVAQSALSLHVKQMEDRFGVALLTRDRHGVQVTEKGRRLMEHAHIILRQMALADAELGRDALAPSGEVALGIPPAVARMLVPRLLTTAKTTLPGVTLRILEGLTLSLQGAMETGRLHLKLAYRTPETVERSLEIAREEFCLVVRASDPDWAERDSVSLSELRHLPLAVPMPNNNAAGTVANVVAMHRDRLTVAYEVDSLSTIINLMIDDGIFSIMTASTVQQEVRDGQLRAIGIVDPTIVRSVTVVTNVRDEQRREVVAVRSLLIDVVRDLVASKAWPATLCGPKATGA